MLNEQIVLERRPHGAPRVEDFRLIETVVPELVDGEVLVEKLLVSLGVGFRNWMDEGSGDHILPAMEIGAPVMGLTLGRITDPRHPAHTPGEHVMARSAWEHLLGLINVGALIALCGSLGRVSRHREPCWGELLVGSPDVWSP